MVYVTQNLRCMSHLVINGLKNICMYWTSTIASVLGDAPWEGGITKEELIDYAERNNVMPSLIEDLRALEDDGECYYNPQDLFEVPTTDLDFGYTDD